MKTILITLALAPPLCAALHAPAALTLSMAGLAAAACLWACWTARPPDHDKP